MMMKRKFFALIQTLKPFAASQLFLSFSIALLLALVSLNTNLFRVEAYFYDLRMRWKGTETVHPDIVLLPLSEKGEWRGTDLDSIEAHALALEHLLRAKPRAVVYLNKFDATDVETKPSASERFVEIARQARAAGTQVYFGSDVDLGGEVLPPYPLSLLPHSPSVLHKDGTMFAEDKVMRRGLLTVMGDPSVHMRVAFPELSREELIKKSQQLRGAYFYEPAESWHLLIRYPQPTEISEGAFTQLSFRNVLDNRGLGDLAGKIILVDTMRRDTMSDFAYTPFSRVIYSNPRIFVHASLLDTLLKNRGMISVPDQVDGLITFGLALALAFVAIGMSPSRGVFALVVLSGTLFLVSLWLFRAGYWLPLVHPFLAMFFTYYLIVPYRAILEYKKRWEVQEKHDLLVQVEEMKGNFLSLMSHDLKTPVARIQGIAEMILRAPGLPEQQRGEVKQIIDSTENLDKFISKILNLTKVESNNLKLNKRTRDVNKLIEKCVEKLSFQAQAKGVEIDMQLDTLFPIPLDSALLIQVFTNIIDNAIKYSPSGSRVKIRSREVGEFVEITVEDNGPGLDTEEQEQLFTKFYRGKSIPGDQTKGSGLGLYLSKYFIELHRGTVEAISEQGQGSKFSIHLPIRAEQ
ncbi:MAG: ATP-binding protein [Bacteriovoracia bacterium]